MTAPEVTRDELRASLSAQLLAIGGRRTIRDLEADALAGDREAEVALDAHYDTIRGDW